MANFLSDAFALVPVLATVLTLLSIALVGFTGAIVWAYVSTGRRDARVARVARASMLHAVRCEAVTAYGKVRS